MEPFRFRHRNEFVAWIGTFGYTQSATLVFNAYTYQQHRPDLPARKFGTYAAWDYLKRFHGRLDRIALGTDWYKKPSSERVQSVTLVQNIKSNLHLHMLWRSPHFEQKLVEALPGIWEKLVHSGDAENRAIQPDDHIYWYDTIQLADDSFKFASEFHPFTTTPTV